MGEMVGERGISLCTSVAAWERDTQWCKMILDDLQVTVCTCEFQASGDVWCTVHLFASSDLVF